MTGLSCNRHLATSVKGTTSKTDTQKEFLKLPAHLVCTILQQWSKYIESEKKKETVFDAIYIAIVTTTALIPLKHFETRCWAKYIYESLATWFPNKVSSLLAWNKNCILRSWPVTSALLSVSRPIEPLGKHTWYTQWKEIVPIFM